MVTAVTRSSPYQDQLVDQHLEMTSTTLNVSGDQVLFSILSPMEFWFLAAIASGLLSWGQFLYSDIVEYMALLLLWVPRRRNATLHSLRRGNPHQSTLTKWRRQRSLVAKWRSQQHPVMSLLPVTSQAKSQLIVTGQAKSPLLYLSLITGLPGQNLLTSGLPSQGLSSSCLPSQGQLASCRPRLRMRLFGQD